jgi:hypothetical protein
MINIYVYHPNKEKFYKSDLLSTDIIDFQF